MSVCIPVQKNIGDYREKIAFGLSAKALGFLAIGLAVAAVEVGIMYFGFGMDASSVSTPVFATVGLAFAVGFFQPLHLPFEKAVPLLLRQYLGKTVITYESNVAHIQQAGAEELRKEKTKEKAPADVQKEAKEYASARKRRYEYSPELLLPRIAAAERDICDRRSADGR